MTAGRDRWPALAALTAGVLAVHGLLLRASLGALELHDPFKPATLVLRTIQAEPPPAPPPAPVVEEKKAPAPIQPPPDAPKTIATPAPEAPPEPPPQPPAPPAQAPAPAAPAAPPSSPEPAPDSARAPAFAIPGSVRLNYDVTSRVRGVQLDGKAQLTWRQDGSQYIARWEAKGPLLTERVQASTGRITAEGLAPERFSDKGSRSEEATHFQRDRAVISFSTNRPEAPLLPGAQDRLSVLLQLGALIAASPAKYPPETVITIQTAGTREAENWVFSVVAEEDLQLPGGPVRALKLLRTPRQEFDQRVEVWLNANLGLGMDYMPVRLRLTSPNGDWVEQNWSRTDGP